MTRVKGCNGGKDERNYRVIGYAVEHDFPQREEEASNPGLT